MLNNHHSSENGWEARSRLHLEKVSGSLTFGKAEQLRRLLMWLGERSLSGAATPPSEKDIAHRVFNRKEFDPQTDSLVRKEMSRLREKLSRYYLFEGTTDEMEIRSEGGYL